MVNEELLMPTVEGITGETNVKDFLTACVTEMDKHGTGIVAVPVKVTKAEGVAHIVFTVTLVDFEVEWANGSP